MERLFDIDELEDKKPVEKPKKVEKTVEEKKPEKDEATKAREEKANALSYDFGVTTELGMEDKIKAYLRHEAETDSQFATKYDESKFPLCSKWLIDVVRATYEKLKSRQNGGIEIPDDKCCLACKHFYNEELWKLMDQPKAEVKKEESKPTAKQVTLDLFGDEEEEDEE